jgi:hypothetical protein
MGLWADSYLFSVNNMEAGINDCVTTTGLDAQTPCQFLNLHRCRVHATAPRPVTAWPLH